MKTKVAFLGWSWDFIDLKRQLRQQNDKTVNNQIKQSKKNDKA